MGSLFHLTTRDAWQRARASGEYRPRSLATEGFIHLSTAAQWPVTLERFYRYTPDLVLLRIDAARLIDVRFESADGELFPHLYEPLEATAVIEVYAIPHGAGARNDPAPVIAALSAAESDSP